MCGVDGIQYYSPCRAGCVGDEVGGVSDCGNAQNCVKVCPKEIPLTEAIAKAGRQTTVHAVKAFFTGKK